jgi:hypothetical protein
MQLAHPTRPTQLHSILLIGFHQSFTRKGVYYGINKLLDPALTGADNES